jgi:alkylated DNA repair dioxygenase AlkB
MSPRAKSHSQLSLFAEPSDQPKGLRFEAGIVSPEEEHSLLAKLQEIPLEPFRFRGFVGTRRTRSFGSRFDFDDGRVHDAEPIPKFLQSLRARAAAWANLKVNDLVHALVTEYPSGSGIGWHRDKAVFGEVIGISLLAPCTLRFRLRTGGWRRASLDLPPRSAYLLRGPARQHWEHSILAVPARRYSITFRTLGSP